MSARLADGQTHTRCQGPGCKVTKPGLRGPRHPPALASAAASGRRERLPGTPYRREPLDRRQGRVSDAGDSSWRERERETSRGGRLASQAPFARVRRQLAYRFPLQRQRSPRTLTRRETMHGAWSDRLEENGSAGALSVRSSLAERLLMSCRNRLTGSLLRDPCPAVA